MLKQKEISRGPIVAALYLAVMILAGLGPVNAAQANSRFQKSLEGAVIMKGAADIADSPLLVFIAPSNPKKDQ